MKKKKPNSRLLFIYLLQQRTNDNTFIYWFGCSVYNSPHFNLSDIIVYLYSDKKETPIFNHYANGRGWFFIVRTYYLSNSLQHLLSSGNVTFFVVEDQAWDGSPAFIIRVLCLALVGRVCSKNSIYVYVCGGENWRSGCRDQQYLSHVPYHRITDYWHTLRL